MKTKSTTNGMARGCCKTQGDGLVSGGETQLLEQRVTSLGAS